MRHPRLILLLAALLGLGGCELIDGTPDVGPAQPEMMTPPPDAEPDMADAEPDMADAEPDAEPDMADAEPDLMPDAEPPPSLAVDTAQLLFGPVTVGAEAQRVVQISNPGASALLGVTARLDAPAAGFALLPPGTVDLAPGAAATLTVRFRPEAAGAAMNTLTVTAGEVTRTVPVSGEGTPAAGAAALRLSPPSLDFGAPFLGQAAERVITVESVGQAPAVVDGAAVVTEPAGGEAAFTVDGLFPLRLAPGEARTVRVRFTPQALDAAAGTLTFTAAGGLTASAPLTGRAQALPAPDPVPAPLGVVINPAGTVGLIPSAQAAQTAAAVALPVAALASDMVRVVLRDADGVAVEAEAPADADPTALVIDASPLADGPIQVDARLVRAGQPGATTTALAVKAADGDLSLSVDAVPALAAVGVLTVTGEATPGVRVYVRGGASTPEGTADATTGRFSLPMALRRNTANTLVVCAERPFGPNLETVCAAPLQVAHLDPNAVVDVQFEERRLDDAEVQTLVDNGIIDLDDPDNFTVSEFRICLVYCPGDEVDCRRNEARLTACEVGHAPVPVVRVPIEGEPGEPPRPVEVPVGEGVVGVVVPGSPRPTAGVMFIDNELKALKEFFRATLVVANQSPSYTIEGLTASLQVPEGMTAIRAGAVEDVAGLEVDGPVDTVALGDLAPAVDGQASLTTATFVIRGDVKGEYTLSVAFGGTVTGEGLPVDGFPLAGRVFRQVQVVGPPVLDVLVQMPRDIDPGVAYPIDYTISNPGPIPARYASLGVRVDPQLYVDGSTPECTGDYNPDCCADPAARGAVFDLGTLGVDDATTRRVQTYGCADVFVVACKVAFDENLSVRVQPEGLPCPGVEIPIEDNGAQAEQRPVITSITSQASMVSPEAAHRIYSNVPLMGATGDSLADVQADVGTGEILGATLLPTGSVWVERLGPGDQVLARVPTTISQGQDDFGPYIELTGGIDGFGGFEPGARYQGRVGPGLSGPNGDPLQPATWTFEITRQDPGAPLTVTTVQPADGALAVPLRAAVVVDFPRIVATGSLRPGPQGSPVELVADAVIAGDSVEGERLPIEVTLSPDRRRMTVRPLQPMAGQTRHALRLEGVRDTFANRLDGVFISSFQTGSAAPAPADPPAAPAVDPVSAWTTADAALITGVGTPRSLITVQGGAAEASALADAAGLFAVQVPLTRDAANELSVSARLDGSPASDPVAVDVNGDPLRISRDASPPQITAFAPENGATLRGVVPVSWTAEDPYGPGGVAQVRVLLEGEQVAEGGAQGMANVDVSGLPDGPATLSFVPRDDLGLVQVFQVAVTIDNPSPPSVDAVAPEALVIGEPVRLQVTGAHLDALVSAELVPAMGAPIALAIEAPTPDAVELVGAVPREAPAGPATLRVTSADGQAEAALSLVVPVPSIAMVTPSEVWATDQDTPVRVTGAGLLPSSQVQVDDALAPTMTDGDALVVTVPGAALAQAGAVSLRVVTPDPAGERASAPATLTVVVPALGLDPDPVTVWAADQAQVTVTLDRPAPAGGLTVALSVDPAGAVQVPVEVQIPAGAQQVEATLSAAPDAAGGAATLRASAPFTTAAQAAVQVRRATLSLDPAQQALLAGAAGVLTVGLDRPAPAAGVEVSLAADPAGALDLPAEALIEPGAQEVQVAFTVRADAPEGAVTVTAQAPGAEPAQAAVTVELPVAPTLTVDPGAVDVVGGEQAALVLTLDPPPAAPLDVDVSTVPPGGLGLPAQVQFAAGQAQATVFAAPPAAAAEGLVTVTFTAPEAEPAVARVTVLAQAPECDPYGPARRGGCPFREACNAARQCEDDDPDACPIDWPVVALDQAPDGQGGFAVSGDTTGAGDFGGAACGDAERSPMAVLRFTAPADGDWSFQASGDFPVVLQERSQCRFPAPSGATSARLRCYGDHDPIAPNGVVRTLDAGDTLYLLVGGVAGATGTFTVTAAAPAAPTLAAGEAWLATDPPAFAVRAQGQDPDGDVAALQITVRDNAGNPLVRGTAPITARFGDAYAFDVVAAGAVGLPVPQALAPFTVDVVAVDAQGAQSGVLAGLAVQPSPQVAAGEVCDPHFGGVFGRCPADLVCTSPLRPSAQPATCQPLAPACPGDGPVPVIAALPFRERICDPSGEPPFPCDVIPWEGAVWAQTNSGTCADLDQRNLPVERARIYAFTPLAAGTYRVSLTALFNDLGDFPAMSRGVLSIRRGCAQPASELACVAQTPGEPALAAEVALAAGETVYVVIHDARARLDPGAFQLDVSGP